MERWEKIFVICTMAALIVEVAWILASGVPILWRKPILPWKINWLNPTKENNWSLKSLLLVNPPPFRGKRG